MTSQPEKQTVSIHNLRNISSKGNQTIKFGQLIEYNMKNVVEKLFPDPSLKNQN